MNRNTMGVTALILIVGVGVWFTRLEPTARGQAVVPANLWEYKIYTATDEDCRQGKAEVEFNKLGAEGWEYADIVVSRTTPPQQQPAGLIVVPPGGFKATGLNNQTSILFKRTKQK